MTAIEVTLINPPIGLKRPSVHGAAKEPVAIPNRIQESILTKKYHELRAEVQQFQKEDASSEYLVSRLKTLARVFYDLQQLSKSIGTSTEAWAQKLRQDIDQQKELVRPQIRTTIHQLVPVLFSQGPHVVKGWEYGNKRSGKYVTEVQKNGFIKMVLVDLLLRLQFILPEVFTFYSAEEIQADLRDYLDKPLLS